MVMMIISILSAAALPHLQQKIVRDKEYQLQKDLLKVRESIDRFHRDWRETIIVENAKGISADGFPKTLDVLIEGVPEVDGGQLRKYLRRVPENPFAADKEEPWLFLGYRDPADTAKWNGVDIFDLRANTERTGLDGTPIAEW